MSFLESKETPVKFQRIDGDLDASLLEPSDENDSSLAAKLEELFKSHLQKKDLEVEAKNLSSQDLPGVIVLDEQSRRLRDYFAMTQPDSEMMFPQKKKFVVNTKSKLIHAIYKIKDSDEELAKDLSEQVYQLSLLSQKELDPSEFSDFIKKSSLVLEKLAEKISV